jgi:N-acetylglucosaminyldiphosphoundecaprenol N-acetyl-beta-D-mannosaminyltransferase
MKPVEKLFQLTLKLNLLHHETDKQNWTQGIKALNQVYVLAFLNAHGVNLSMRDQAVLQAFLACDSLLRDGIGMKWMLRMQGIQAGLNMNGTDLIPELLKQFKGKSVALWGTQDPYLDIVASRLSREGHQVVSTEHGFHDYSYYQNQALKSCPQIIILGMGMPKQEILAIQLKKCLKFPCLIICGGAIIDFLGGKVQRAPLWMRKMGLEWFYRLVQEPHRLFQRYVIGNVVFLFWALRLRAHSRSQSRSHEAI